MPASSLLRASRLASGLTQVDLAVRAETSQPEVSSVESGRRIPTVDTLERLLRQTGHRIVAVPDVGSDADETAARIARVHDSPDDALRAFLDYSDTLARADGTSRVLLSALEPRPTGSRIWDAALAGLVDYWLSRSRLPRPTWIVKAGRTLDSTEAPGLSRYDLLPDPPDVPREFLRRNVLIARSTLESV